MPYLVDRVTWPVFVTAIMLLILTLIDGVITVVLLEFGFEEANPVMRYLLERGTGAFFVGKYVLTAIFLPVALVMYQYRLFGTRLRVGHFIPIVAALYLVLITYQIVLLKQKLDEPSSMRAASSGTIGAGKPRIVAPARQGGSS